MKNTTKLNSFVDVYTKPVYTPENPNIRTMALYIDEGSKDPILGLVREIAESSGSVHRPGFVDRSKFILVEGDDYYSFKKVSDVVIEGLDEHIADILEENPTLEYIGPEDPTIHRENGVLQVYFSVPFKDENNYFTVCLGYATGESLRDLKFKRLVAVTGDLCKSKVIDKSALLFPNYECIKELAVVPRIDNGTQVVLVEGALGNSSLAGVSVISEIRLSDIKDGFGALDKYHSDIPVVNPNDLDSDDYRWISGHASPCYIFLMDEAGYNLCIINGREKEETHKGEVDFGKFTVGLMNCNLDTGVCFISKQHLFDDPDAKGIIFASQFIKISDKEGLLYCHIDDAYIKAYRIKLDGLVKALIV